MNYGNKMENAHIDDLDMGDWITTTYPDIFPYGTVFNGDTSQLMSVINNGGISGRPDIDGELQSVPTDTTVTFPMGEQPWVAFPVYNSSAGITCNTYAYKEQTKDGNDYVMQFRPYSGSQGSREDSDSPINNFAVQPYVWIMAQKIAEATGFSLDKQDNALYTNDFFRRVFIVNTNNLVSCAKCLPHWTVNEFWTEVENTFGMVLDIDYSTMSMRLRTRTDFYKEIRAESMTTLPFVLDEFSLDMQDETRTDISVNSVGFSDFDNGSEDLLSDGVTGNAEIINIHSDINQLLTEIKAYNGDRKEKYKRSLFECADGRQFIYASDCGADAGDRTDQSMTNGDSSDLNGGKHDHTRPAGKGEGLAEVNMFRPRMKDDNSDDIDISLRFVPARYVSVDADIYEYSDRHDTALSSKDKPVASFPVTAMEAPGSGDLSWRKSGYYEGIDLEAIINGEADVPEPDGNNSDLIYIAIDNAALDNIEANVNIKGTDIKRIFTHPRALLRERTFGLLSEGETITDPGVSLSLIPIQGQRNLASETISNGIRIDTTVRHCIRFISGTIPEVTSIFNIRNQLFVCEKIEADIKPEGLCRLMTGYFYKIGM